MVTVAATPAAAATYVLLDYQGSSPGRVAVYAESFVHHRSRLPQLDLENLDNNFPAFWPRTMSPK